MHACECTYISIQITYTYICILYNTNTQTYICILYTYIYIYIYIYMYIIHIHKHIYVYSTHTHICVYYTHEQFLSTPCCEVLDKIQNPSVFVSTCRFNCFWDRFTGSKRTGALILKKSKNARTRTKTCILVSSMISQKMLLAEVDFFQKSTFLYLGHFDEEQSKTNIEILLNNIEIY